MLTSVKDVLLKLCILFVFYDYATGLIIPEELPTILSLIYSNIPPIKKGTDSRIGVGFRLGQHADFQVLLELGPQTETEPIGNTESKKRRAATLTAAMKGDLGPVAQAVAKYQIERTLQKELERLRALESSQKKEIPEKNTGKEVPSNDWLNKWRKDLMQGTDQPNLGYEVEKGPAFSETKILQQRIGRPPKVEPIRKDKFAELSKLYKLQTDNKSSDQLA